MQNIPANSDVKLSIQASRVSDDGSIYFVFEDNFSARSWLLDNSIEPNDISYYHFDGFENAVALSDVTA